MSEADYELEIGDREFHPIPESWLDHPQAFDAEDDGPRCLAVSCAVVAGGRKLRVRYAHLSGNVVTTSTGAAPNPDGDGYVPSALVSDSQYRWPRSWIPQPDTHLGIIWAPEREHLRDLWADRLDDLAVDDERQQLDADPERQLVADGGQPTDSHELPECGDCGAEFSGYNPAEPCPHCGSEGWLAPATDQRGDQA